MDPHAAVEAAESWYCPQCRKAHAREERLQETWKEDARAVETILTVLCPACGWTSTYRL